MFLWVFFAALVLSINQDAIFNIAYNSMINSLKEVDQDIAYFQYLYYVDSEFRQSKPKSSIDYYTNRLEKICNEGPPRIKNSFQKRGESSPPLKQRLNRLLNQIEKAERDLRVQIFEIDETSELYTRMTDAVSLWFAHLETIPHLIPFIKKFQDLFDESLSRWITDGKWSIAEEPISRLNLEIDGILFEDLIAKQSKDFQRKETLLYADLERFRLKFEDIREISNEEIESSEQLVALKKEYEELTETIYPSSQSKRIFNWNSKSILRASVKDDPEEIRAVETFKSFGKETQKMYLTMAFNLLFEMALEVTTFEERVREIQSTLKKLEAIVDTENYPPYIDIKELLAEKESLLGYNEAFYRGYRRVYYVMERVEKNLEPLYEKDLEFVASVPGKPSLFELGHPPEMEFLLWKLQNKDLKWEERLRPFQSNLHVLPSHVVLPKRGFWKQERIALLSSEQQKVFWNQVCLPAIEAIKAYNE